MNSVDSLTGFLNRFGCFHTAMRLAAEATGNRQTFAVIWLDLDRFKQINESFGHLIGDEVIENLATRFRPCVSGRAEISRVGGDEFVLLAPGFDRTQALQFAAELADIVQEPLHIGSLTLRPTASIGIAIHEPNEDPLTLLERADHAMFAAKSKGGNNIICSGDEPIPGRLGVTLAREELSIESTLHEALETGGFCLHYQPIIHADGTVEAVEALMRCKLNGENISPMKFIPVAEKTGVIIRLGEFSLLQGAMHARTLHDAGHETKVAINVSRAQLVSPAFTQALHAALLCSNVSPNLIELELTESLFMDISDTVQQNLKEIIATGVSLSIDDFGTGYSCLASLKDIPAGKLKLDRAFVTVLPDDRRALSVVKAVTQLGHELGMTIVAEGCENQQQIDVLLEAGVDAIQGFFYAKPMPDSELLPWLKARSHKI
ncbi:MAG: bifunctional diguanylate cyclase/phosphodiesterase [Gammaproteobacteria bacterium]|nr:bifunctional diguanylate cyclase/phosphodiesterase [Gammaproteobacteria bacterium]MBU1624961.1 bifunctional diguanylate cyclase/phosphodiesterase [Gammaproteobacteria bacterium]MBU1981221.1 bifunctional diguanylate cyclase/phosphodiesterase [Gammaproteobacteria bacterium]